MSNRRWDKAVLAVLIIGLVALTGCGKNQQATTDQTEQAVAEQTEQAAEGASEEIVISHLPEFTDTTFDTSEADMLNKEGEPSETYPSLYGGTVYVFPGHEYKGVTGSVKYMTDDKGNIASMSWLYESDDVDSVAEVFNNTHDNLTEKLGSSGNSSAGQGSIGDAWNFDDVHIMIDAVITNDYKGMQVTYLKAEYSKKDIVDQKRKEREDNE